MGDTNTLSLFGRLGKGIFTKPKNEQEFKIQLDEFKVATFTGAYGPDIKSSVDRNRKDKLEELKKTIAEAINAYLIFNKTDSPIKIEKDKDYGGYDIKGLDKLFEQGLTKITITKSNGEVKTYEGEDLKTEILDKHRNSINNEFSVSELLDRMYKKNNDILKSEIVDAGKAKLTFTFDMTKLLSLSSNSTGAGHRRSSHKIVRKTFKHSKRHSRSKSRKSSRKYRNRK